MASRFIVHFGVYLLALVALSGVSFSAFGADSALSAQDLKKAANQEIQAPTNTPVNTKRASDAALPADSTSSGILRLKDEYHSLKARQLIMTFGVQLQSYKPAGSSDATGTGSSYNLAEVGSTVLPSISLGTLYNLASNRSGDWQLGLEGEAGYISQKTDVATSTGSISARLNTTLLDLHPLIRWSPRNSKFHLFTGYGWGHATVTQSSSSSVGQWSKSGNTNTWLLGADYAMNEKWLVQLASKSVTISKADDGFDLPSNQVELGAKVLW